MLDSQGLTAVPDAEMEPVVPDSPDGATETLTATATEPGEPGTSTPAGAGQPRDQHGRFAPKAETDQALDTDPDGEPGETAELDPLAPDANPDQPAAALPATEVPPEASADQPFTFRHRGQMHGVEGAVLKPDGSLLVAADSVNRFRQLAQRGREAEVYGPQQAADFQREREQWRAEREQRHAGIDAFGKLLDGNPDPETFLARCLAFYEDLPKLREQMTQAEIASRDRRIAELEGRPPAVPAGQNVPSEEITSDDYVQEIHKVTGTSLQQARQALADFKDFTDAELNELYPRLVKRAGQYVRTGTQMDLEQWGPERVRVGQPVFDEDAFVEELRLIAGPMLTQKRQTAAKAKQQQAVDAAAKRNAAVTTPVKVTPVPRQGGEMAGGGVPQFKSKDEYDDWVHSQR